MSSPQQQPEIVDLSVICKSFPEQFGKQIQREGVLALIEQTLSGEIQIARIEGEVGHGKTTTLAQFVKKHNQTAISLFVRATSRLAYDFKLLLFDLCNQINWILTGQEIDPSRDIDDGTLRTLVLRLQQVARLNRRVYYFVIDGLDEIPADAEYVRDALLNVIPFGFSSFKFVVSSTESAGWYKGRGTSKSLPLPFFGLPETLEYFSDTRLAPDLVEEFHRTCLRVPGNLANVKQLLASGFTAETIIQEISKRDGLLELSWQPVTKANDMDRSLLGIVALDDSAFSIQSMSAIFGEDAQSIRQRLSQFRFLTVPPSDAEPVDFVSRIFKNFAAAKLAEVRQQVNEKIIDYLLARPESDDALSRLPQYLQQVGRQSDLLRYLSPDRLAMMVERSHSTLPVKKQAELGLNAAAAIDEFSECVRFGLQQSDVADLDAAEVLKSEIEARVALGEYDDAVALANAAVLKEDRLRLLAILARRRTEKGLAPSPELLEEISRLFDADAIDRSVEWINELAGDLLYSRPELALTLVDRVTSRQATAKGLDWELVKLSAEALAIKTSAGSETRNISTAIKERIKDPVAARFSTALAVLVHDYSAARVLAELSELTDAKEKLYLLRGWARHTQRFGEAADVIDAALKMTISASTYTPHASHFRDLAEPLAHIDCPDRVRDLIAIFDAQKATSERMGPTEDYVQLQLTLAHAEMKFNAVAGRARILDLYFYIGNIADLATRTACDALLVAALPEIDPNRKLEESDGLHTIAEQDLAANVDSLLASTADHLFATRNVVSALAIRHPDRAIEIALKLNVEPRRDRALCAIVSEQLGVRLADMPLGGIERALLLIKDNDDRDEMIAQVCSRIAQTTRDESITTRVTEIAKISRLALRTTEAHTRVLAECNCIVSLLRAHDESCSELIDELMKGMRESWSGIPNEEDKIDAGFRIAALLAQYDNETAIQYCKEAEELRRNSRFQLGIGTFIGNVRLAIRALAGLLPTASDTPADLDRLKSLISDVPSREARLRLWVDLALRLFLSDRPVPARGITVDEIKPLLGSVKATDVGTWHRLLAIAAPPLYLTNSLAAVELLDSLPVQWKDFAYTEIITLLLRRVPPSDPFDASSGRFRLTWEDVEQICTLMPKVDIDGQIYGFIRAVVESARWKENRFTRNQKDELARMLEAIVQTKLPAPRFITHTGYRVISMAQIARLRRADAPAWKQIIEDARTVPNVADRAMVLAYVAEAYTGTASLQMELLKHAREAVSSIPSILDRVDRLEMIADCARDIDKATCLACLNEGISEVTKDNDPDLSPVQKRLVDLAHKVNKEMAASFAEKLDDDPARRATRSSAKEQVRILQLRQTIADGNDSCDFSTSESISDLPRACWMLVAALNANRVEPQKISTTLPYVRYASALPLSDAFPIMAWVIENATSRVGRATEAKTALRGLFEAVLLGCDLAARLAGRVSTAMRTLEHAPRTVIRAGERDKALQHIREWLSRDVTEYLKITDPYFGPEELSILQLVLAHCPGIKVTILTSKMYQERLKLPQPWEDSYQKHWTLRISDQKPPSTKIVILGLRGSGEAPIHDRWLISSGSGLRLGTSLNSLGISKDSDISRMDERDAQDHEAEVDEFIVHNRDEYNGQPLSCTTFYL